MTEAAWAGHGSPLPADSTAREQPPTTDLCTVFNAIFTCFAPGANSACWSQSSHAQASSTAIFVLGSKRRPARKRFNRFALTLLDSLANVFNEWLNRNGRKGNSMV